MSHGKTRWRAPGDILGSNEDTVARLPGNRAAAAGEDERQRRDGTKARLSTDDEAAAQRMRDAGLFVS